LASQGTALNRETVSDQIYARLCASLSSGELAPGDRLSIRKIGAMFGISMMPVREAVARLVVNKALEILPNKAIRVPIMTPESFRELTTVRIHIESFAAVQAAQNRSDDELAEISACEANFRRALRNPDKTDALRTNKELHFAVYRASHLPTLVGIAEMLWLRVGPIINLDLFWSGSRSSVQHHRRLVQAITVRDDIEAGKALTADVLGTANFILESGHFRARTRERPR
jgi:DNA-binding GntR family transcriptional regulator